MTSVTVHHGDSRDVLKTLADASIDSCVCDPPYALISTLKRFGNSPRTEASMPTAGPYMRASRGFMGQKWDTGETAFDPEFWAEVLRVLKPGGHVVAASGTRTYHRLACAIEDAGFEVRDMVSWLYGSGFPKSHNVGKKTGRPEDDGWGTALKPACEPWALARKPLDGTVAGNVLQHGTGALNIDGCRVEHQTINGGNLADNPHLRATKLRAAPVSSPFGREGEVSALTAQAGRWPANVVHDGSDEVVLAFPTAPGQQGDLKGHSSARPTKTCLGDMGPAKDHPARNDSGSAARFFYSAKADAEDRLGSKHPTVKPVDLMQWLCRLVTPPGGLILDPFAGRLHRPRRHERGLRLHPDRARGEVRRRHQPATRLGARGRAADRSGNGPGREARQAAGV
jgi:site-specific DNA-methyltransferase (adenine-specific)